MEIHTITLNNVDTFNQPISITPDDTIDELLEELKLTKDYSTFCEKLKNVLIKFNTDPKFYSKHDYFRLILSITSALRYFYEDGKGITEEELQKALDELILTDGHIKLVKNDYSNSSEIATEYKLINRIGEQLGDTIQIFKDKFLRKVQFYKSISEVPEEYRSHIPDDTHFPALMFIFITADGSDLYIWVPMLIYDAGQGLKLTDTTFSGVVDNTGEFLSVSNKGFKVSGISNAINQAKEEAIDDSEQYTDEQIEILENKKLNKVTSVGKKIYGVDNSGNQIMYTAGSNIQLNDDGTISATDTVYDDTELKNKINLEILDRQSDVANLQEQINEKLHKLIPGENITISDENVISAKDTIYTEGEGIEITEDNVINCTLKAEWGSITGDIEDQEDLINKLNEKLNGLTPGENIQISEDNIISATDTIYDDTSLRIELNTEKSIRSEMDSLLLNSINLESNNRSVADSNLQTQINTKLEILTPGTGIEITDEYVINNTLEVGDILIYDLEELPEASETYSKKIYRVDNKLYHCIKNSGSSTLTKFYSFENVVTSSTSEFNQSNWNSFAKLITNGFVDDFNFNLSSKSYSFYQDDTYPTGQGIKFGSSKDIGILYLDRNLNNQPNPISKVEVTVKSWNNLKDSEIIIEIGDEVIIDEIIAPGSTKTISIENTAPAINNDKLLIKSKRPNAAEYRMVLVDGISVTFGISTLGWRWELINSIDDFKYEKITNKVTEINLDSTNDQYPSAKAVNTLVSNTRTWVFSNYQLKITENNPLDVSLIDGLADVATSGEYSDLNNIPEYLSDFIDDLGSTPIHSHSQYLIDDDLKGFATEEWVQDQGYLKEHLDISGLQPKLNQGINIVIDSTTHTISSPDSILKNEIVNNVTSEDTDKVLSAKQGKVLQDQIDNLKSIGRFLSLWDCTTGLPTSDPLEIPYTYNSGDYYTISKVGETNYKPSGLSYTGDASTIVETETVAVNDMYYFDNTTWVLLHTVQKQTSFANIAGHPSDNLELATELNKIPVITSGSQNGDITVTVNGTASHPIIGDTDFVHYEEGSISIIPTEFSIKFLDATDGTVLNPETLLINSEKVEHRFESPMCKGTINCFPGESDFKIEVYKSGYNKLEIDLTSLPSQLALSKKIAATDMLIIVTWEGNTLTRRDLDSYLNFEGDREIYYSHLNETIGDMHLSLDLDDRGYNETGIETVRLVNFDPERTYRFYIKDYTNTNTMRNANPITTIYYNNTVQLVKCSEASGSQNGNTWNVFSFNVDDGFDLTNTIA